MSESSFLNPQAAILAANISHGSRVADLAAGSGFFTRAAARIVGPDAPVWAIDPNQEMLVRLKNLSVSEGLHTIEIARGTPEKLNGTHLPDATIDFCILANALFSMHDKDTVAKEAYRVLRKAGRLLLIDWSASHGGLGPHEDHIISAAEARTIFERAGFTKAEDIPVGGYHWGLILRKK